jgi:mannose/fructose/N-acetylgalactosamine-specific phosphotransferase system component IIC
MTTVMFVLLGFVLTKFLGLGTLPVAIIGVVIAFVHFQNNMKLKDASDKKAALTADTEEGDDFFG